MFSFPLKLILCYVLLLGGSAAVGHSPGEPAALYRREKPDTEAHRLSPLIAAEEGPWDDGIADLEVQDSLVYCAMGDGLLIVDISDPSDPQFVSRMRFPSAVGRDLRLLGDYIYLCSGTDVSGMVRVIDVSDPAAPFLAGSCPRPGARGLDIMRNLAFVANGEEIGGSDGMYALDITDPDNLTLVDSIVTNNEPVRVRVRDSLAYMVGFGGLYIIDISDPDEAAILSQYPPDINYIPWDLDLREGDSLLYIADLSSIWPAYGSAFSIYNVSDPENPSLCGRFPLVGYVMDVKINGNYAFVSHGSCGLQVFDITDPTSPRQRGAVPGSLRLGQFRSVVCRTSCDSG